MTSLRSRLVQAALVTLALCRNPRTWPLVGFALGYVLYFVRPTFGGHAMHFPVYIDALDPIGWDLNVMLGNVRVWLQGGGSPYLGPNPYPPLTAALFIPLAGLPSETAYRFMVAATLLAYVFLCLVVPRLLYPRDLPLGWTALILVTGLTSYGLQFELERGQFNVVAVALAMLGVVICRRWPRAQILGAAFIVLAAQLKIYPIVFTLLLVDEWRGWRRWLPLMGGILAANLVCLLLLGPRLFREFLGAITEHARDPGYWIGNHSAFSFTHQLTETQAGPLGLAIIGIVTVCLAVALARSARPPGKDPHPFAILACTLAALIVPSASHDYKLALLAGPVSIFLAACLEKTVRVLWTPVRALGLTSFALAYSATLVSYTSRPSLPGLGNRLPPLMTESALPAILVILLSATVLSVLPGEEGTPRQLPTP